MSRVQLNVWVEEGQRDAIKARAAERGVPVGVLVAEAVLGAREPVVSDPAAREALDRVAGAEGDIEGLERRLARLEEMAGL